jgi:hypothetical protein
MSSSGASSGPRFGSQLAGQFDGSVSSAVRRRNEYGVSWIAAS